MAICYSFYSPHFLHAPFVPALICRCESHPTAPAHLCFYRFPRCLSNANLLPLHRRLKVKRQMIEMNCMIRVTACQCGVLIYNIACDLWLLSIHFALNWSHFSQPNSEWTRWVDLANCRHEITDNTMSRKHASALRSCMCWREEQSHYNVIANVVCKIWKTESNRQRT